MFEFLLNELEEAIVHMTNSEIPEDIEYFRGRKDAICSVLAYIEEGKK